MRKELNYFRLLAVFSILPFINACTDDYFEFDKISTDKWQPELAIPLVNSTLTLEDIVLKSDTSGLVQKNPSNEVLEIVYDGRVFSTRGELVVDLPNQTIQESFQLPTTIPPSPSGGNFSQNFSRDIDFNNNGSDLEIDSVFLKNGVLQLSIQNDFQHNVVLEVIFPSIKTRFGSNLTVTFNLPPAPNSNSFSSASRTVNLNEFMADMSKDRNGNAALNKIPVEIRSTFNLSPNTGLNSGDAIRVNGSITNLAFQEFYGYIGRSLLDLREDSIQIDLFKNFVDGTFFISNPILDITVSNSFGTPIEFNFQRLDAQNNDKSPSLLDIQLPQNPISLNFPSGFGVSKTKINLTNTNSNIDFIVSFLTKQILYKSEGFLNPNGKTAQRNFLTDTSQIGLDVFLIIPFEGSASGFRLIDTIDFNFENSDQIDNGLVRVRTENGFPIDADLQLYFLDENLVVIDSLYPEGARSVIKSSLVDANGKTIENTVTVSDTDISSDRIQPLNRGKFAVITATLNSLNAPNQNVRFFEEYRLSIDVGIKAKFLID